MRQVVTLNKNSRRADFHTEINWKEKHKILKVEFPVGVNCNEAISEIQFGYVKRPTHRSRQYDKDRFEVPQQKYTALAEAGRGVALLNDSKYGVSLGWQQHQPYITESPRDTRHVCRPGRAHLYLFAVCL